MTEVKPLVEQPRSAIDRLETWLPRVALAIVFVLFGALKFAAHSMYVRIFDEIGLGQWFRYFTGTVELVGGLLFLIPAATAVGAAMLIATMCGAMAVHFFVFRHPANSIFPAMYLVGVILAFAKLREERRTHDA